MEFNNVPAVSREDLQRFYGVATILDEAGFTKALQVFFVDKIVTTGTAAAVTDLEQMRKQISRAASALRAAVVWEPSVTELQLGRALQLKQFNAPHNLPLARFAALACKSRQQIYKDIAARRLLALSVGGRGKRLPDWQLIPAARAITAEVLARAGDIDPWTIYDALTTPHDQLGGRCPVAAWAVGKRSQLVQAVMARLGIHPR